MYPPARGSQSNGAKHGNVFPLAILGTRRPSNSCCPSAAAICEKFTIEPFAPDMVIKDKQFLWKGFFVPLGRQTLTVADVTWLSAPEERASSAASESGRSVTLAETAERNAISGTSLTCTNASAADFAAAPALANSFTRNSSDSATKTKSSIPHVNPCCWRNRVSNRDNTDNNFPAICFPCNSATACIKPNLPNAFLSTTPVQM